MITLRPDQLEVVGDLRAALPRHKSVLLRAQTGFGKTIVASYLAAGALAKGTSTIIAVHRNELLRQTSLTLNAAGVPHGIIAAGIYPDPTKRIQVASADTLRLARNAAWLDKCELFIPDEAHLWAAKHRAAMILRVLAAGGYCVGLTATPRRLDGKGLDHLFRHMVSGPTVSWLMDQGFLSRYRAYAPVRPDLKGVRKVAGDYAVLSLESALDKPMIVGDAVTTWRKYAHGLRTLVFAISRRHGAHLLDAYQRAGIGAVYIDGDTPKHVRRHRIEQFATGEAMVLISINLCTEGFDLSAQVGRDVPVEAVQLLRPTSSLPLARQMIGRALRPKPNPAVILDHANILATHGLPDDEVDWTLEGEARRAKKASDPIPLASMCPGCFFYGRPFRVCPQCGLERPLTPREVQEQAGELGEVELAAVRAAKLAEQARARTLPELVALARARGYRHPEAWAKHIIVVRMNRGRGRSHERKRA